jgi:hypothetical protein
VRAQGERGDATSSYSTHPPFEQTQQTPVPALRSKTPDRLALLALPRSRPRVIHREDARAGLQYTRIPGGTSGSKKVSSLDSQKAAGFSAHELRLGAKGLEGKTSHENSFCRNHAIFAVHSCFKISFLYLPVLDGRAPIIEQAREFIRFVDEQRSRARPVVVHCEAGLGRTGTMLALYLISQGQTAEAAIANVKAVERAAIETGRQRQFLQEFARLGGR